MTDKIDAIFNDIDFSLNNYSGTAEGLIKQVKSDIQDLNVSIEAENNKISAELKKYQQKTSGGNKNKTFLAPSELRDTYKRIKISGGSKQDTNNMIYTIEKMQKMGINRNFFPNLLQTLKAHR